jgi:NADPH-dependent 2,4-dienoyl-CoA reductase/sulfur reductase-like enzyme
LTKDYMQGKSSLDKAIVESLEFYRAHNIELMLGARIERLDAAAKVATLAGGEAIHFEKALLATGGRPRILADLPGQDLPGVHYFRTLADALAVSDQVAPGRRVAIIGGGFIGLELASSFTQRGADVTLLERSDHVWMNFADADLAEFFQDYCRDKGVTILTGERAIQIDGDERASAVVTASGKVIDCDLVVIAAGIVPNVELAQQAGLTIDNGVVVNELMQTSDPDIFAAGDVANFYDPYAQRRRRVEHWGMADYSGALAGENMAGGARRYDLLPYVFSDVFDLHLEFAGDETARERAVLRGTHPDKSFALCYLKGCVMTAFFAVNLKRKQFGPLVKLIEQHVDLTSMEENLADPEFDLTTLLRMPAGV